MAQSPAHAWGQAIGNVIERGVEPLLQSVANEFSLYLDKNGPRAARRGKKVTWTDKYGNTHDLDFVLERGGTDHTVGDPAGFVEVAWRRYTKHSRNKAQEIQGAVLPLAETYAFHKPFLGAVISGEFTDGAMEQLSSLGFQILYFDYESVLEAFGSSGIDARTEESTPDPEVQAKVDAWQKLSEEEKDSVAETLFDTCSDKVAAFTVAMRLTFGRIVERIRILPLFGSSVDFRLVNEAQTYLEDSNRFEVSDTLTRIEIEVTYSNGDSIVGKFNDAVAATSFLETIA